jgi:hypothetical protein
LEPCREGQLSATLTFKSCSASCGFSWECWRVELGWGKEKNKMLEYLLVWSFDKVRPSRNEARTETKQLRERYWSRRLGLPS